MRQVGVNWLQSLPLLRHLQPVELAKLLPDIRVLPMGDHEQFFLQDHADNFFVMAEGRVEIRSLEGEQSVWVTQLKMHDLFGEATLLRNKEPSKLLVLAIQPSVVVEINARALTELLREKPEVRSDFDQAILRRLVDQQGEIIRSRKILSAYSNQLWEHVDAFPVVPTGGETDGTAVAQQTTSEPVSYSKRSSRRKKSWDPQPLRRPLNILLATLASGLVAFWPGLSASSSVDRYVLAILLWGGICWLMNALPDYVVALTVCLGLAVSGLVEPSTVMAGFSNPTWFLLLGFWAIGVVIGRTGLLYRLVLHMLGVLPNSYLGQSLALAVTGLISTPLFPSSQGRLVMAAPLTLEMADAMRFAHRDLGATGLGLASFLGFGQMYFLFLNGTTTTLLAWSLLPSEIQARASWSFWLLAALPVGLIVFVLSFIAIINLLPASTPQKISRDLIRAQLKVLGPMQRSEITGLVVILSVLIAFLTTPFHGLEPAWFAVAGMLTLLAASDENGEKIIREIDWRFLLFFGAVLSIAGIAREAHLDDALGGLIQTVLEPVFAQPVLAVGAVATITLLFRLLLSPIQVIPLLTIALIPVFVKAGYNPLAVVLTVVTASTTFIARRLSPNYMTMLAGTRGRLFAEDRILPLALVHSGILLLALLLAVPFWRLIQAL